MSDKATADLRRRCQLFASAVGVHRRKSRRSGALRDDERRRGAVGETIVRRSAVCLKPTMRFFMQPAVRAVRPPRLEGCEKRWFASSRRGTARNGKPM